MMKSTLIGSWLIAVALIFGSQYASAGMITTTFTEVGDDVLGEVSGQIDLSGLVSDGTFNTTISRVGPAQGFVSFGTGSWNRYLLPIAAQPFGTGGNTTATSTSGGIFGFNDQFGLFVASSYVSNTPFSASSQWDDASFASLGMEVGSYTYQINDNNAWTIKVGAPVPAPATLLLFCMGFGLLGLRIRQKA